MQQTQSPSNHRARWAAIGAAVAVTLGAGGLGIANATSPDGASAYVPITPCRIIDTRAGSGQLGPQSGPLGPDGVMTVDGWGDVAGDCNLPTSSTGLQLNVTGVNSTQDTFLTLYPQGATRPLASNVNVDSSSPTPNSATVTLNATNGQFHVFNRFGTIDVVIDVAGYYTDHQHDGDDIIDASLTGADVANNTLDHTKTSNEAGIAFNAVQPEPALALTATDTKVVTTSINVPSDGYVVALVELFWDPDSAARDEARCQVTKGADTTIDATEPYINLNDFTTDGTNYQTVGGHAVLPVAAADDTGSVLSGFGQDINLVCDEVAGNVFIRRAQLTLQFFPTNYTKTGIGIIGCPPVCFPFAVEPEE